jgi:rhodanese-related sulfurtransferase
VILHCASGGGSALAGKAFEDMGYADAYDLGGFGDAASAGLPIEPA